MVDDISNTYTPIDLVTRHSLKALTAQMQLYFPALPLPRTSEIEWRKTRYLIRRRLQKTWGTNTKFETHTPGPVDEPPVFILSAQKTLEEANLDPLRQRAIKMLIHSIHRSLFDYLNETRNCISGITFNPPAQGVTKLRTMPAFNHYWGHSILRREETAGVTIALLLWKATIIRLFSAGWRKNVLGKLELAEIEEQDSVMAALNDIFNTTEVAVLERKMIGLGKFLYNNGLSDTQLQEEFDSHWKPHRENIFWEILYAAGPDELKTQINDAQLLSSPGSMRLSEPELLVMILEMEDLPWKKVHRHLKLDKDPRQFLANLLSKDARVKRLATNTVALDQGIKEAREKGYLGPKKADALIQENGARMPFSHTVHKIRRSYAVTSR